MNSIDGRPVHFVEEAVLKETGFANFTTGVSDKTIVKPVLLLAARKIKEI